MSTKRQLRNTSPRASSSRRLPLRPQERAFGSLWYALSRAPRPASRAPGHQPCAHLRVRGPAGAQEDVPPPPRDLVDTHRGGCHMHFWRRADPRRPREVRAASWRRAEDRLEIGHLALGGLPELPALEKVQTELARSVRGRASASAAGLPAGQGAGAADWRIWPRGQPRSQRVAAALRTRAVSPHAPLAPLAGRGQASATHRSISDAEAGGVRMARRQEADPLRAGRPLRPLPPILFVYSLINRYYILDFLPGRSLIEFMTNPGLLNVTRHRLGTPGPVEQDRSVERRRTTCSAGSSRRHKCRVSLDPRRRRPDDGTASLHGRHHGVRGRGPVPSQAA